jgi:hypothetical protein
MPRSRTAGTGMCNRFTDSETHDSHQSARTWLLGWYRFDMDQRCRSLCCAPRVPAMCWVPLVLILNGKLLVWLSSCWSHAAR